MGGESMAEYTKQHLEILLDLMPYPIYMYDQEGLTVYQNRRGEEVSKGNVRTDEPIEVIMEREGLYREQVLKEKKPISEALSFKVDEMAQYVQRYLCPILDNEGKSKYIYTIYKRIYNELLLEHITHPYYEKVQEVDMSMLSNEQICEAQKILGHIIGHILGQYRYRILWEGDYEGASGRLMSRTSIPPRALAFCRKMIEEVQHTCVIRLKGETMQECALMALGIKEVGIYPLKVHGHIITTLMVGYETCGNTAYKEQHQVLRICNQIEYYVKMLMLLKLLKREGQLLEKIEKERQTLIEAGDQVLCTLDWEGNFIEVNKGFEQILGYTLDGLENMKLKELLQEVQYCEISDENIIIENGGIQTADGRKKWLSWNIVHKEVDGEPIIIAGARDMTAYVEDERSYTEDMHRLQKEKSKSEVYATLSHELKTPLNIMLASCEMLRGDNRAHSRWVNRIERRSYMMLKQVNDVIDLTKIGAGYYQTYNKKYNFVEVVEDVIEVIAEYLGEEKSRIVFDTMEEELIAEFDRDVVERIVFNLVGDALERSVTGETIEIMLAVEAATTLEIRFVPRAQFTKAKIVESSIVEALLGLAHMQLSWKQEGRYRIMCVRTALQCIGDPYCISDEEQRLRNRQKCKMELAYLKTRREPKCS